MIWATVSSRSCFFWLYRVSQTLTAKNIIRVWYSPSGDVHVFCVVGRGCLLWPVHSLGTTLLASSLLHFVLQGQTCMYSGYLLTSYFYILIPYDENDIFFGISFRKSCINGSTELFIFIFFNICGQGIDLDYHDIEWKWTEIILQFLRLHPSTACWTLLLTMRAASFLLRYSCP